MGLLKSIIVGRENGIRSKLRKLAGGSGNNREHDPSSAYSAPRSEAAPAPAEKALGLFPEAPKDVTPPEGYEVVLHKDALKPGKIVEIIIGGKAIAVANVDGQFFACTNSCPHADGPLGEGTLEGGVLSCPYHGWRFDLKESACLTNPDVKFKTYQVAVEKDAVCVRL